MFYIKIDDTRFTDASISVLKTFYLSKTFLNYSRLVIIRQPDHHKPFLFARRRTLLKTTSYRRLN